MPEWPDDLVTRLCRFALRAIGWSVPPSEEWEAELWQMRDVSGPRRGLVRFLAGALWHGLWEWKEGWRMDSMLQDVRYAFRTLLRSRGFTAAAVLILGLSIGANTALFSVIESAVLSEPPYSDPERLVVVDMLFAMEDSGFNPSEWSYPRYRALDDEVRSIEPLAGYASRTMTFTEFGDPAVVSVEVATPSLFSLLGVRAERGRLLGPGEEDDGSPKMVALVGHSFWVDRLGGRPDVIGSSMTLDQLRFEVIGVVPDGFDGITGGAQVWIPMSALREVEDPTILDDPWNQSFHVMGRLASSATLESARSEVQAFGATVMERFPPPVGASRLTAAADVLPYAEARLNPTATASMIALFGAVALVLLIATANLAGLLLARGETRHREAAIRVSLGAGRGRLIRQMLTESLALAVVGGALGVALASFGVDTLGVWLADALGTQGGRGLQYLDTDSLAINWKVLAFAMALTGGAGICFGLLPALQVARTDPNAWLKGGGAARGILAAVPGLNSRNGLVASQVAVALVLLAGASLMVRSLIDLQRVDLGYDAENLLTAMYSLSPADEAAGLDPGSLHPEFIERVRALPGVSGATLGEVPMGGPTWRTIVLGSEARPELTPAMHTWIRVQPVADGHVDVLGLQLIEGRDIEPTDEWNTEKVIVLSRMAAEQLSSGGSPLGRRVQFGWPGYGGEGATVIGVVEDVQFDEPGVPAQPLGFVPVRQAPQLATGVMVRSTVDPQELIPAIRSTLAEMAPNVALTSVMSMEKRASGANARSRVVTALLTLFGLISLVLVAAGLYGSIAFAVARRTRELGLRASLGADRFRLAALVLRQGLGATLVGVVAGILGSLWATRFMGSLVFGARSFDPVALLTVVLILMAVAGLAAYLPARKATRADPMLALRAD
jgi:putative ABC transport system permease protein